MRINKFNYQRDFRGIEHHKAHEKKARVFNAYHFHLVDPILEKH